MIMKKLVVILTIVALLFAGCVNNNNDSKQVKATPVEYKECSVETYTKVMDSKGYSCAYYSAETLSDVPGIDYAIVAQPYGGYLIEYYVFDSFENGKVAYDEGVALAETYGAGTHENMAVDNQLSYVSNLENSYYRYFLRDNVLIVISTRLSQYKEDAEEVADLLIKK